MYIQFNLGCNGMTGIDNFQEIEVTWLVSQVFAALPRYTKLNQSAWYVKSQDMT